MGAEMRSAACRDGAGGNGAETCSGERPATWVLSAQATTRSGRPCSRQPRRARTSCAVRWTTCARGFRFRMATLHAAERQHLQRDVVVVLADAEAAALALDAGLGERDALQEAHGLRAELALALV